MTQQHDPKARPILFSAPMIRALLEGRKTQTRRIVKPQPIKDGEWLKWKTRKCDISASSVEGLAIGMKHACPYGQPGDLLWVREAWEVTAIGDCGGTLTYKSDNQEVEIACQPHSGVWKRSGNKPSIHMPRWASRLTLEITDVRIERLQDISEEDAVAEGCFFTDYGRNCYHSKDDDNAICKADDKYHPQKPGWFWKDTTCDAQCLQTAKTAYWNLWNSINGADSWDQNPWVWVLEFRVHQCNVDGFLKRLAKEQNHE